MSLESQLYEAIESGDKARVIGHLQQTGNVTPELLRQSLSVATVEIVTLLTAFCPDLDVPGPEGTALKMACELGYADVVETLLCNGAALPAPKSGSLNDVFFVTSYSGWLPVLEVLLDDRKEVLYKAEEMKVILEGACFGGQVHILRYCIDLARKHGLQMDVLFPHLLAVACQAASSASVECLLKAGAVLTDNLIDQYPETIKRALALGVSLVTTPTPDATNGKEQFCVKWNDYNLCSISPAWFQQYLDTLVELDLSENKLASLPPEVPWQMNGLVSLHITNNRLDRLAEPQGNIRCKRLQNVNLSHNCLQRVASQLFQLESLQTLSLSDNCLTDLATSTVTTPSTTATEKRSRRREATISLDSMVWQCAELRQLDVSHNQLRSLPEQICFCGQLRHLEASNNCLDSFPPPWSCPLEILRLSHNELKDVQCSLDVYWSRTLVKIYLSHNQLTEIPQSVCRLESLKYLDVSNNQLASLPAVHWWGCHLEELILTNNQLTQRQAQPQATVPKPGGFFRRSIGSRGSDPSTEPSPVEFPSCFADSLSHLDLSHNRLMFLPVSLCQLLALQRLNVSYNSPLKELPLELANLQQCFDLGLEGLRLRNIPRHLLAGQYGTATSVLTHLKLQKRKSVPYSRMKLMVVGRESKGKTSLVARLLGHPKPPNLATNGIVVHQLKILGDTMKSRMQNKPKRSSGPLPDVTFQVWDFAGQSDFYVTHKVFLSPSALYLLVFDLRLHRQGLEGLKPWLLDIQAHAAYSTVVLVGTFLDYLSHDGRDSVSQIYTWVQQMYPRVAGYPNITGVCAVSCHTGEGVDHLRQTVYSVAMEMEIKVSLWTKHQRVKVIGRQVPKSYVELEKLLSAEVARRRDADLTPVLQQDEYIAIVDSVPDNDITTTEEIQSVTRFLHEAGSLLHFEDQLRGLGGLYFIDPSWLAQTLAKFITIDAVQSCVRDGKMSIDQIQQFILKGTSQQPVTIWQYIQLLEKFEVALMLDSTSILLPCRLPAVRPGLTLSPSSSPADSHCLHRLFKMPFVPSGFWSRLITRILTINKLLRQQDDSLRRRQSAFMTSSIKHVYHSFKGREPTVMYWQQGLYYDYHTGFYCIEAASHYADSKSENSSLDGVLVTFQSDSGAFSAVGFVLDQVESVIKQWYPGLDDGLMHGAPNNLDRLILCPACVSKKGVTAALNTGCSLSVQQCTRAVLASTSVTCPKCEADLCLDKLIPDLLLNDLEQGDLFLDQDRLEIQERLGHGGEASVYRGTLDGKLVAVKQAHVVALLAADRYRSGSGEVSPGGVTLETGSRSSSSSRDSTSSGTGLMSRSSMSSLSDTDSVTSYVMQTKVLESLRGLRQEASLLSRLHHPCVVCLLGVSVPLVSMVLELCTLGSLRSVLEATLQDRTEKHACVLGRKTSYNVLLQIGSALSYLHSMEIIYKDLKCDNVLVCSLHSPEGVSVKVSDYGLSSYSTPQGVQGNEGTPGFQAPEMVSGSAYTEKVDIFAFGMVIYEVVTAQCPFLRQPCVTIQRAIVQGQRPSLQHAAIDPEMPALEKLMTCCWQYSPATRPSAAEITHTMRDASFLCHQRTLPAEGKVSKVTCCYSYKPSPSSAPLLKLWAGGGDARTYHILNVEDAVFKVSGQKSHGHKVMCMTTLDNYTILGNAGCELEVLVSGEALGNLVPACDVTVTRDIPLAMHTFKSASETVVVVSLASGHLLSYRWLPPQLVLQQAVLLCDENNKDPAKCLASVTYQSTRDTDQGASATHQGASGDVSSHQTELWAGCGGNIVVLEPDTMYSTEHVAVFDCSKRAYTLVSLVSKDHQAWCIAYKHTQVVELDVQTKEILCYFDCSGNTTINEVIVSFDQNFLPESELKKSSGKRSFEKKTSSEKAALRRKLSLRRQQSPKQSKSLFGGQLVNQACDLACVNGTLWVGRRGGDIVVINTTADNAYGYKYGQVMATLCNKRHDNYHQGNGRIVKLEHVGLNTVVAVRTVLAVAPDDFEELEQAELVVWQAWGLEDIHRLNTMWGGLEPK